MIPEGSLACYHQPSKCLQSTQAHHTLSSVNQIRQNINLLASSYILILMMSMRVNNCLLNTELDLIVNTPLFLYTEGGKLRWKMFHLNLAQGRKYVSSNYVHFEYVFFDTQQFCSAWIIGDVHKRLVGVGIYLISLR
jgi:hypothetical protein